MAINILDFLSSETDPEKRAVVERLLDENTRLARELAKVKRCMRDMSMRHPPKTSVYDVMNRVPPSFRRS